MCKQNQDMPSQVNPQQEPDETESDKIDGSKSVLAGIRNTYALLSATASAFERLPDIMLAAQRVASQISPALEQMRRLSDYITNYIAGIQVPQYYEEHKQQIVDSQRQWGVYGWSWFLDAPIKFYFKSPLSADDANAKVKPFCSPQHIQRLFSDLRKRRINKRNLESAIYCYDHKQYTACALLLFSMLDSIMIRKQPKGAKRRPVGGSAVKELKKQEEQNETMFFTMLHCLNLFACLEVFFADARDFRVEPPTINRNYIDHGMNQRVVRKRDCIQLFLALNNLLFFYESKV